ncbi:glutathione S-transferase family protein [Primorskyibacter marinus]|uniref:glutathione S-transferase family protein n=1 Tax=Primorskyibacter marinus TaxID=1977320 RepID=UPI0018E5774F|nr:glutathione S-transferase family protein [Primorskyibacter marinus]
MIELFNSPRSTCSQKVRLVLAEKGLSFENRPIDLAKREHHTPEYLGINPNGVIPALRHDGFVVTDSSVICEYLEDVFPAPPLMPPDPRARAKVREWMRFIEEVPTSAIRIPVANQIFAEPLRAMSPEAFAEWSRNITVRRDLYVKMRRDGFGNEDIAEALERLALTISRADAACTEYAWLAGEDYTLADILLLPTIARMEDLGYAEMWSGKSGFVRWYDNVQRRPSFDIAFFQGSRMASNYQWSLTV